MDIAVTLLWKLKAYTYRFSCRPWYIIFFFTHMGRQFTIVLKSGKELAFQKLALMNGKWSLQRLQFHILHGKLKLIWANCCCLYDPYSNPSLGLGTTDIRWQPWTIVLNCRPTMLIVERCAGVAQEVYIREHTQQSLSQIFPDKFASVGFSRLVFTLICM